MYFSLYVLSMKNIAKVCHSYGKKINKFKNNDSGVIANLIKTVFLDSSYKVESNPINTKYHTFT